jgi:hypothetical protein
MKSEEKDDAAAGADEEDDGDIQLSGHVSGGKKAGPGEVVEPQVNLGFAKLIDDYGADFPNSRSRKSVVFVPTEKEKPLRGWKSLRHAGLSSKKLGKIAKNGDKFVHTAKDGTQGDMYFLNNKAWKSLKRKKQIVMED